MTDRLKHIKENLMCAVEAQMYNLEEVDTKELGEAIDMIKDLEEAIYYCAIVKAMEESEKNQEWFHEPMYYTPTHNRNMMYYNGREMNNTDGRDNSRSYYNGNGSNGNGSISGSTSSNYAQYSEREFPHAFDDPREGRSYRSRRMYMESKETHQDKTSQMKELEKYAQELTSDIVEMIDGASPEEKQYLSKKISALAAKIS